MKKKPTIVLTHYFDPRITKPLLKGRARVIHAPTRAQLERAIPKADGLLTLVTDRVDEALLAKAPHLRVVGNFGVGYDNIDLAACKRRGIRVVNTPRVLSRATAELALALLLAVARRIPEGEELCRTGSFDGWSPDMLIGLELKGRTAVLVGPGRIGRETARLFKGIGMKAEWIRSSDSPQAVERKLKRAQVLSLHVPLNAKTRHWLDARKLALLPRDAIVINTSRGPVIDEESLIRALEAKRLFGAGLDVYEREPHVPRRLRKLENVVLLPHLGSATRAAREGMARLAATGVLEVLGGKRPWNAVV